MLKNPIYDFLILLAIASLQQLGIARLAIFGVSPDLVTIYLAMTAIRSGQKTATSFGFFGGIFMGFLGSNMGLEALTKTIEGFLAGYFFIPEDSHATYRKKMMLFYKGVLYASIVGKTIYTLLAHWLSLPAPPNILLATALGTLLTMTIAVAVYQFYFKQVLT